MRLDRFLQKELEMGFIRDKKELEHIKRSIERETDLRLKDIEVRGRHAWSLVDDRSWDVHVLIEKVRR